MHDEALWRGLQSGSIPQKQVGSVHDMLQLAELTPFAFRHDLWDSFSNINLFFRIHEIYNYL